MELLIQDEEIGLVLKKNTPADPVKKFVPAMHFGIIRKADLAEVGLCDLRLGHTEGLFFGGNIGYEVFPDYRGNRYAAKACRLLFQVASEKGLQYLSITCNPNNLPSRKTCLSLSPDAQILTPLPEDNNMYLEDNQREVCVFLYYL